MRGRQRSEDDDRVKRRAREIKGESAESPGKKGHREELEGSSEDDVGAMPRLLRERPRGGERHAKREEHSWDGNARDDVDRFGDEGREVKVEAENSETCRGRDDHGVHGNCSREGAYAWSLP